MYVIQCFLILLIIPLICWDIRYPLFLIPAFIITGYVFHIYTKYDFNGYIYFNESTINIDDIVYDYIFIDKIVINVGSIVGNIESVPFTMMFFPPKISKGTDNSIKIISKGKKKKYTLLCETNYDYINLKEVSFFLKEKGVGVKLRVNSVR
jgi:hypothetical protein